MRGRKLSPFETAMAEGGLEMRTGTPNVISAALYFKQLPSHAALSSLIQNHFLSFDALAGAPCKGRWESTTFDESKHLLYDEVSSESQLLPWMEHAMMQPILNKDNGPWWELHAVSTKDSSQALLFVRIEHACADGIALAQVLNKAATALDGSALPAAGYVKRPKGSEVGLCSLMCDALQKAFKYAVLPMASFDSDLPFTPPLAERSAGLHYNHSRRLVRVPPHSLDMLKRIKQAAGDATTVNDVVYAAFAGSLRRYCLLRIEQRTWSGSLSTSTSARALIPVAFPRPALSPLVNDWTFVNAELPIAEKDPKTRLRKVHAIFSALKVSTEPAVSRAATAVNANNPACIFGMVGQQLLSRHSFVFSNVPGPASRIKVAGEEVLSILPMFPNLIPQLLCVSYDGTVYMTLVLDGEIASEAESIASSYLDEISALAEAFGVSPA